jgi:xylose isomerase
MQDVGPPRYAARLNAFGIGAESYFAGRNKITILDLIARAGTVEGLNAADLNYPDHFADASPAELILALDGAGMALNGLAMRYYTDPGFKLGAFTNPSAEVRRAAIDLTKRGIDALAGMGGRLMTLWMGQDGVDYSFQGDYRRMWDDTIAALAEVADHNPTSTSPSSTSRTSRAPMR